jgi:hypothetical protein
VVTIALYFGIAVLIYRWAALGSDLPPEPLETEAEQEGGNSIEPA